MRFLLLALLAPRVLAAESDLYDIRVSRIADGVYVAARPDPLRSYVEGNVTILINDRDVVVVDAGGSPRAARKVIAEIRKLTANPVRFVIHTHIHRDHRWGVQEYVKEFPGVEIIAHPIVREVVARSGDTFVTTTIARLESRRGETQAEIQRLEAEGNTKVAAALRRYLDEDLPVILGEYRSIRNLAPTMTFTDRLTLHRGERTIELLFLGRGDTDHDVVVHLPREKVVVAGDMVVHPFPYGFSTQPAEWIATLKKLRALDFDQLVPGHGDVQRGKGYLDSVIELVSSVQTQVGRAVAAGKSLEETRKAVDLTPFEKAMAGEDAVTRYYFQTYFVEPAVAEAYKELSGKR
ncbi:MAG TPA: MBL fold metallo-hydrolase [Thermoanaerobaculia bacterium]|nr:MBL fold metallo-hydrolase [Thermoanaerobaculia bacterium]